MENSSNRFFRRKIKEGEKTQKINKFKEIIVSDLLKPSYVKQEFDSIQVNSEYNKVVVALGYPRLIKEGWLDNIVSTDGNFDLSLFIEPRPLDSVLSDLNQQLIKQKSDLSTSEKNSIPNNSLKLQYDDTLKTLELLQTGKEKLFDFSLYINSRGNSKDSANLLTKKLESTLNSILIVPKIPYFKMKEAFQSIIPIQKNKLNISRNILSNALSACFPFTSPFLSIHNSGLMFGVRESNNIPIIVDSTYFTNSNGLILGSSGSGKSFFTKLYLIRNLLNGVKTCIIDPQGEYSNIIKNFNGQIINLSSSSNSFINPLDLMGKPFDEKILFLLEFFDFMFSGLTEKQKNLLYSALMKTYKTRGILAHDSSTWLLNPPTLSDLFEVLKDLHSEELMELFVPYVTGPFNFLNNSTHLNISSNLISFNISDIPRQIKPIVMQLVLDFLYSRMKSFSGNKLLIIDEAWLLLQHKENSQFIFEMIKTARKFNLGLVIVSQEVNDLLSSDAGKTILANTSWKVLFRQEPAVISELSEKLHLNKEEQTFLLTCQKGEGLFFAMNERIPLKVLASRSEKDYISYI